MVFISYARQNGGAAFRVSQELESRGVKTWLDIRELPSGANWHSQIASAVRSVNEIVFLIGPPGAEDSSQRYEWEQVVEEEFYLDPSKVLIPVILGQAETPGFLKTRQAIRVEESPDFGALAEQIKKFIDCPEETIDKEKMENSRAVRDRAQQRLREYILQLEEKNVKQAGLGGLT